MQARQTNKYPDRARGRGEVQPRHKRLFIRAVTGFTAAALAAGMLSASGAGSAADAATCQFHPGQQPPSPQALEVTAAGVAVLSPCNAWLVGRYMLSSGVTQTLIEHWNGSAWKIVPSANPAGPLRSHYLAGVAAVSAGDIWAVGFYDNGGGLGSRTLIERWNGTSWKVIKSPNVGTGNNFLLGVTATSSGSAWAVGHYLNGSIDRTLVEHWNGTTWKVVKSPSPGGPTSSSILTGIAATSAHNAWAVGGITTGTVSRTLVMRWNGTSWKVIKSPHVGTGRNFLEGVAATSATDAWAVGWSAQGAASQTLIEHWNGTSWKRVKSPNPGGSTHTNSLAGVAVTSGHDAWAVGQYSAGTVYKTLVEHWDGTSWKHVKSANPGGPATSRFLFSVDARRAGNVWAVGIYGSHPLALHWG
jgi:hypothetical protein